MAQRAGTQNIFPASLPDYILYPMTKKRGPP